MAKGRFFIFKGGTLFMDLKKHIKTSLNTIWEVERVRGKAG
jgi:hypothetical protein